jgi:hypothetical protein
LFGLSAAEGEWEDSERVVVCPPLRDGQRENRQPLLFGKIAIGDSALNMRPQ